MTDYPADPAGYLTVPEAAGYLRISVRKVYDLVSRNGLPHRRAGGRLLFERIALAQWVRSSEAANSLAPSPPPVLAGSHDALLDWAVRTSHCTLATLCRGSRDGVARVRRREACAALLHLPGRRLGDAGSAASAKPPTGSAVGQFNVDAVKESLTGRDVVLLNWCWRQQGLMVARGNPLRIRSLGDLLAPAARPRPKIGRRAAGAGSRELFDRMMAELPTGEPQRVVDLAVDGLESENDAAMAVRHGHVDAVFGAQSAAQSFGLDFVPLLRERVDLLLERRSYFEPPLQQLLRFCRTPAFANYAEELGGYDLAEHGAVIWNGA